jgi:hypothetical protein
MRRILDEDDPKAIAAGITLKMIEDNWFASPLWQPDLGKTDNGGDGDGGASDGGDGDDPIV